jgi:hypothetical protein
MRIPTVALLVGVLACRPSAPTTAPESESPPPAVFAEQVETEQQASVEAFPPITPGVCPAEVGMAPTPFFDERVLVRMPVGLENAQMVEVGRFRVMTLEQNEWNDCRPGAEGPATIVSGALTLQLAQEAMSIETRREFALAESGYPADSYVIIEGGSDPASRKGMWVLERTSRDGLVRMLVAVKESSGLVVTLILEAREDDWPALVDSFVESGKRLLVVPG